MFLHRVKLLTLAGFTVWIDASWLIFAGLFAWTLATAVFPSTVPGLPIATYWWMAVAGAIGLLFSIIFHELSHSLAARRCAIPISGITLFIFGGVAELGDEPNTAKSEFLTLLSVRLPAWSWVPCCL
jgi:Zn-dependent protease